MNLHASRRVMRSAEPLRRAIIARLRIRQITQREITIALQKEGNLNPVTGKPWSLGQVNIDVKAIEEVWKKEMLRDTTELKANLLAEIREVRRKAWADGDIIVVLHAIKQERELLGLDTVRSPAPTTNMDQVSNYFVALIQIAQQHGLSSTVGAEDFLSPQSQRIDDSTNSHSANGKQL